MKFVLTEREKFEPDYTYTESFNDLSSAQARMNELYHELAVDNVDAVEKAELNERSAVVYVNDGNIVEWDIAEA